MLLVDAHDALMLDMNQFVDEYIRQTSPTMQAENENNGNAEGETAASPQSGRPLVINTNTLTWRPCGLLRGEDAKEDK